MAPQELIISSCSSETASTSSGRTTAAPAVHLHDLQSGSSIQPFKTSLSASQSVSYIPTQNDVGGAIFAVQEGKAIVNVWAWQKVGFAYLYSLMAGPNALEIAFTGKAELFQGVS